MNQFMNFRVEQSLQPYCGLPLSGCIQVPLHVGNFEIMRDRASVDASIFNWGNVCNELNFMSSTFCLDLAVP